MLSPNVRANELQSRYNCVLNAFPRRTVHFLDILLVLRRKVWKPLVQQVELLIPVNDASPVDWRIGDCIVHRNECRVRGGRRGECHCVSLRFVLHRAADRITGTSKQRWHVLRHYDHSAYVCNRWKLNWYIHTAKVTRSSKPLIYGKAWRTSCMILHMSRKVQSEYLKTEKSIQRQYTKYSLLYSCHFYSSHSHALDKKCRLVHVDLQTYIVNDISRNHDNRQARFSIAPLFYLMIQTIPTATAANRCWRSKSCGSQGTIIENGQTMMDQKTDMHGSWYWGVSFLPQQVSLKGKGYSSVSSNYEKKKEAIVPWPSSATDPCRIDAS